MNAVTRKLLASASLAGVVLAQCAVLMTVAAPALAGSSGAGGKGGDNVPLGLGGAGGVGSGGAVGSVGGTGAGGGGGSAGSGTGGNGGNNAGAGGGGGVAGGAGAAGTGNGGGGGGGGGANGLSNAGLGAATGGAGGAGGAAASGGGGGGAGGFGIAGLTSGGLNTFTTTGGVGGAGGASAAGGVGGTGGAGIFSTTALSITNSGTLTGGAGGAGGAGTVTNGAGGDGGDGIAGSGLTIFNTTGTITGGAAGAAGGAGSSAGLGGAAIAGANLIITNAGTLAGGAGGNAVNFTGGVNSLTLQASSSITGNAVAFSTADTLALGGAVTGAFDVSNIGPAAQYRGFGIFEKTGTSLWTLSGTTAFGGTTLVSAGTLALTGTASIANSSVTNNAVFDISATTAGTAIVALSGNGALALGAKTLTISNGAGTYSGTSTGTGGITVSGGTTTFSGAHAYTGATAITGGTLALSGGASIATSSNVVANGALDITGVTSGATLAGLTGSGTVALGGKTLTLNSGDFSGAIGGSGGNLTVAVATTTLRGANSFTGVTSINSGTLAMAGTGSIAQSASLSNLATFDISQTTVGVSVKSLSGPGIVALGSKSFTLTAAGGTFSGAFQDGGIGGGTGGRLAITGSGTEILTGTSTHTGATTIGTGATLQIGNNATDGALGSGPVTSNGTLAYFLLNARTISNVISGTGGLTQGGTGTLTLAAAQAYSGTTAVNSGRILALAGAGNLASSAVADAGTFDISQTTSGATVAALSGTGVVALGSKTLSIGSTGTFAGVVADNGIGGGTGGGVTVTGGTPIFTGANTYTGLTTIAAGASLQLGAGGSTGALGGGPITDNGVLVYNRSDAVTLPANISGSGGVRQAGSGSLTVTGDTAYAGTTTISAGTLQVGAGGTTGAITGAIVDNSLLSFNRSNTDTVATAISGTGALAQNGSGNLILTGISNYSGATGANSGILSVNGAIASSAVSVASGARLGGTGTVGTTTINSGGMLAPGNSIGTLNVAGNVIFNSGSRYLVEVDSSGAADRIAATGAATINGGTVEVQAAAGTYGSSTTYTVLTAGGGVTGAFTGATSNFIFLTPTLNYGANAVTLTLTQPVVAPTPDPAATVASVSTATPVSAATAPAPAVAAAVTPAPVLVSFPSVTQTFNQTASATALQAGGAAGGPLFLSILNSTSIADARAAFDAVSGEIYATLLSAQQEGAATIRRAMNDRMRHAASGAEGWSLWGYGTGNWGRIDGDGNAAAVTRSGATVMLGADTRLDDNWRGGFEGGYDSEKLHIAARNSDAQLQGGHLGAYAHGRYDANVLRAGLSYGFGDAVTNRGVGFAGFDDRVRSSQQSRTAQLFGEAGHEFAFGTMTLEPFAGFAWTHLELGAFHETGGASALAGASHHRNEGMVTAGLQMDTAPFGLADGMLTPGLRAGWQHAINNAQPIRLLSFLSTGQSFTVQGTSLDTDRAVLDFDLALALGEDANITLGYGGAYGGRSSDHAIKLTGIVHL